MGGAKNLNKYVLLMLVFVAAVVARVLTAHPVSGPPIVGPNELTLSGVNLDWTYERLVERFGEPWDLPFLGLAIPKIST